MAEFGGTSMVSHASDDVQVLGVEIVLPHN